MANPWKSSSPSRAAAVATSRIATSSGRRAAGLPSDHGLFIGRYLRIVKRHPAPFAARETPADAVVAVDADRGRSCSCSASRPTTCSSASTRSCGCSRSSGTCGSSSRLSGPSCASTSSPATTRSGRSTVTSGAGSTRPPSTRTRTTASAPTTISSSRRTTSSSSRARSRSREPRPADDHGFDPNYPLPCAKVLGAARGRTEGVPHGVGGEHLVDELRLAQRTRGRSTQPRCRTSPGVSRARAKAASPRHHQHGGDLVWQIGTGYFGCRDARRQLRPRPLRRHRRRRSPRVKAIEIKISQGAKPGLGGLLPQAKITKEIAETRGIPMGIDCVSPASHSAFHDADSLLDFAELLAETSGLPVGVKSAVGDLTLFQELARLMTTATAASTSSRSTAARAAPVPGRSRSSTTSRCRSDVGFRACLPHVRRARCHRPARVRRCRTPRACPTARSSRSRWGATA